MDWMLFWTALMAATSVMTVLGGIFAWLRKSDLAVHENFRQEVYDKFIAISRDIEKMTIEIRLRLEKSDFVKHEERQDKELAELRRDARESYESIMNKIEQNQKDLSNKLDQQFDRLVNIIKNK